MKNIGFVLVTFIVITLCGCDSGGYGWPSAPERYDCTEEQMTAVAKETKECDETRYLSDYCYSTAIMRRCKLRADPCPKAE